MRILYLRTNSFQCDPHVGSILQYAEGHPGIEVVVKDYFVSDVDNQITEWAAHHQPNVIIWLGVCGSVNQPRPLTFWLLRKSGIKTIMLCPEASHPDWDAVIETFRTQESFDLIVNLDGKAFPYGMTTLAIYDQRPYAKAPIPWAERKYDVGFCGGVGFIGTMRQKLISHFRNVKSCIFMEFPFTERCGTYQDYADFMMNCRVIINSAGSSGDKSKHVKGRVIEAGLAGCALVEEEGSPIDEWFSQGTYELFSHPVQAEMLVLDLLANPERAQVQATKLFLEVREKYSPQKIWAQVLPTL